MDELDGNGRKPKRAPSRQRRVFPHRAHGFTMVELIVTMIIVGIMAVAVVPRFAEQGAFESRGFRDESLALLRWAQKSAVAQRRTVCVYFTTQDAWAHIRAAAGDTACGASAAPGDAPPAGQGWLTGASGGQARASAPASTGYVAEPADFRFEASGRPSQGQTIGITGSANLAVEADTGYVH
jgi:MSHA pilin protein MshC